MIRRYTRLISFFTDSDARCRVFKFNKALFLTPGDASCVQCTACSVTRKNSIYLHSPGNNVISLRAREHFKLTIIVVTEKKVNYRGSSFLKVRFPSPRIDIGNNPIFNFEDNAPAATSKPREFSINLSNKTRDLAYS